MSQKPVLSRFAWEGRTYYVAVNVGFRRVILPNRDILEISWISSNTPPSIIVNRDITSRFLRMDEYHINMVAYWFCALVTEIEGSESELYTQNIWNRIRNDSAFSAISTEAKDALAEMMNQSAIAILDMASEEFTAASFFRAKAALARFMSKNGFGEIVVTHHTDPGISAESRASMAELLESGLRELADYFLEISEAPDSYNLPTDLGLSGEARRKYLAGENLTIAAVFQADPGYFYRS